MELVDKFDNRRAPLNKVTERFEVIEGEYRQSMHLWIMNDKGEFLIQKRSDNKKTNPGLWSITGGGVEAGERSYETVIREAKEELGVDINPDKVNFMLSIKRRHTFADVYLVMQNVNIDDVVMQEEEVSNVKWATVDEIKKLIDEGQFTSSIKIYLDMLLYLISE
ncbi:MAG: NUDIX domain-containing protein [Clostridia bacterium]|nr:NUDIX domain-containing protein [Clostridia bacterium]